MSVPRMLDKPQNKLSVLPWQEMCPGDFDESFNWFLQSVKGQYLLEALDFALEIAAADDIFAKAKQLSDQRATCRFQRLARNTLGDVLEKPETVLDETLAREIVKQLESPCLATQIHEILRMEFGDGYPALFGGMLQFDYALGFFQQLAQRAVHWLNQENEKKFRTGWMYNPKTERAGRTEYPADYMARNNAECVVNNYMMILAGIFGEIHRITADIDQWNIEFEDAKNRLSGQKCSRLLGFDGAYRQGSARHLLMKELMLYKA